MVLLFWRAFSRGRSKRVLLGASLSVSEDEEADEGGLTSPSATECEVGCGIGGVVRATGSESSESMTGG